ncbi:YceD family protein [Virgibacillus sp. W0430]|uniref:YceD family protein n=1 Tax=Virgibacillus sp. W0430 TaxID=3391580 RepID=UPI003F44E0BD
MILLKFTLAEIRKKTVQQPFAFNEVVQIKDIAALNNDIRNIDPVHVEGSCIMQGDQIIFSLDISGEVILPCARTLVDVPFPFNFHATEIFTTSNHYDEEDEEDEIHPISGEVLDLIPLIKENILLEIPYRVFSDNVKDHEQATIQGKGWAIVSEQTIETEDTNKDTIDPRLQKLSLLLDKNNDD